MINEIMTKSISKICCIIKSGFISELNIYLRCDLIIEAQILGVIEMIKINNVTNWKSLSNIVLDFVETLIV